MNMKVIVRALGLIAVLIVITGAGREMAARKETVVFRGEATGCQITDPNGKILFKQGVRTVDGDSAEISIPRGSLITAACFASK